MPKLFFAGIALLPSEPLDLSVCDREPIHTPSAIQSHGVLLVLDRQTMKVTHCAGDVLRHLGRSDWAGALCADLLGSDPTGTIAATHFAVQHCVRLPDGRSEVDITHHTSGKRLIIEIEPVEPAARTSVLLAHLETAANAFAEAADLRQVCQTAATEFRRVTGFDRVMVYQFLEDDTGMVIAEELAHGQQSFLNHRFPASDIPRKARALYVRNLVRVIPDASYEPASLEPPLVDGEPLDMSDCVLRSVSPIHVRYLKNMGVAASASLSIVKDGTLWGLVACHNKTPRKISAQSRAACRAMAGSLAREIKGREDTDAYRERVRLRSFEDRLLELLLREGSLAAAISKHIGEIRRMLDGDGVVVLRGTEIIHNGHTPCEDEIRRLASWVVARDADPVFATSELTAWRDIPEAERSICAGLLALTLSRTEPWLVMWFRAEEVETINWAGNPHKSVEPDPDGVLNPRASFDAWHETVRGKSRRWTVPETEAASRLYTAVMNVWQTRRIRDLNRELLNTIDQKEALISQRDFLLGEINHRVQNSLQLVSSFLSLQARELSDDAAKAAIEEARRRISAVSLVHRRLYKSDQIKNIDSARYLDELLDELITSFGDEWQRHIRRDLDPVLIPSDRAIAVGLVLTELVINANKYAYDGAVGPILVSLSENRNRLRLVVADQGKGRQGERKGFGSRLLEALVEQLGGDLKYEDGAPGTRATLDISIET